MILRARSLTSKFQTMEKNEQQMPRLGEPVPAFEAMTTKGKISFPDDYKGKWVILFSHPADFTPICTTGY